MRPRLTEASLREPLRRRLASRARFSAPSGVGLASAVLIPLFEERSECHAWMVRRSQNLRNHSGQVAFPGGKHDADDDSLLTTALREAEEEIGLARTDVDVLGAFDDLVTTTGYVITPYVAWVRADLLFTPNPAEVARVFAAPLGAFLEAPEGVFPRIGWQIEGELVWGATAMIVSRLAALANEIAEPRP